MKKWQKTSLISITVLLVAGVLGAFGYVYNKYQTVTKELEFVKTDKSDMSGLLPDDDQKSMIEEVAKLIDLPTDETPQVAVVTDETKLKSQPFFTPARNGDWVLAYRNIKRVILYRPSIKKIIDVANAVFADRSQESNVVTDSSVTVSKNITVAIRNASGVENAQETVTKQLATISDISITESTDSAGLRGSSLIVKQGTTDDIKFQEFVDLLGYKVGQVPDSEKSSDADILILIGSDITN
ncbi:hypothetical protein ACFL1A_02555 [Patescibacteria group bacterium]